MGVGMFDAGAVQWPGAPNRSKQVQYKRRAYGSVKCTGNDQFNCSGGRTLSFYSGADPKVQRGGRYAPAPHLTSITTKNQGGGDISEASLWEVEFTYECYDKADLDGLASSFMVPGSIIIVKFGWNTGGSVSIGAKIYDYSWTYNLDNGSWSCTGKALGGAEGIGALTIKTTDKPTTIKNEKDKTTGYSLFAQLDMEAQKALNVKRDKDGKLTGGVPGKDGSAKQSGDFGIINAFVESGIINDTSEYQTMVRLGTVIGRINASIQNGGVPQIFKWHSDKYQQLASMRSADPLQLCFPGAYAAYHPTVQEDKNNFSALTGAYGKTSDLWVSTKLLMDVEESLLDKSSDKDKKSEYTANSFLAKLFGEISNLTGGLVDIAIFSETGKKGTLWLVNRSCDVSFSGLSTLALRGPDSPVKACSMSTNLDPDMAAIAFAGASGKYPASMADKVFKCTAKNTTKSDSLSKVQAKTEELGEKYDPATCTDFKKVLREYVNENKTGTFIRYNIDLSVTCDGFSPKFGQAFKVSPIPSSIGGSVKFIVGEIEHKVDGATWDTGIVGYMMVDV